MDEDNLDPNNEPEENASGENLPQEGESKKSETEKGIDKKVQEQLSKSSMKNAAMKSLIKVLLPVLMWVLFFIIILIVIIGIVMFFLTMPGMVIEQIKQLARNVGEAVASWFGRDDTKQVSDEDINEVLDYLEQMGYDLKGYGFLTDTVGSSEDGVERYTAEDAEEDNKEEGKIKEAKSDIIRNYLISDNYVYTIKNFNMTSKGWFTGILEHIASFFTGGQSNQFWSRGMIEIWKDTDDIGVKDLENGYYDVYEPGSIKIDVAKKTMEIARGWFNNSMTYSLDGWTGRYGMPIDFLLSVHIATMMPDLSYDMATSFETLIEILLHSVGDNDSVNTAVSYYKTSDGRYVSYDEFYDAAKSGWTGPLNAWKISKKEAMKIMKEYGIESPDDCTGVAGVGEDNIEQNTSPTDMIYTKNWGFSDVRITDSDYDSNSNGTKKKQEIVDNYNAMIQKLKSYGATDADIQNAGLKVSISDFNSFLSMQQEDEKNDEYTYIEPSKRLSATVYWKSPDETSDYGNYSAQVELGYDNYNYMGIVNYNNHSETEELPKNQAFVSYNIIGTWSTKKINEWKEENNVTTTEEAKCSQKENETECCNVCRDYIQSIYDKLKKPDVEHLDIFQPYITSVTKHWYRDVYFVSSPDRMFVDYDYDYEALMKERWTLYETYGEEGGEKEGEYKLYTSDGNLFDGTAEDAEEQGIKVAKKAIARRIDNMAEDLNWVELTNGHYSAYSEDDNTTTTDYEPAYPDVDESDPDYDIKKDIFVRISLTGTVKQTGEGQRTETNEKIKKMFLENEYFRYDGSAKTADAIINLRKAVTQKYNSENDGDDISNYYGPMKGTITINGSETKEVDYSDITAQVDGKVEKVSDYIGTVSLNQDSLNAFSMLENEHTLDADYIYRDFKELIVELGYFTKEELTDETPRLLEFLVPDIGSYLYPRRSIDKNENEAGTMIHSKGDIDVETAKTLMAIYQKSEEDKQNGLVDENIETGDMPEEQVETGDNPEDQVETGDVPESISMNQELKTSSTTLNKDESLSLSNVGGMVQQLDSNINIAQIVGGMGFNFERIAESGDGYDFKVRNGNVEYTHYYQFKGSYSEKQFLWCGSPRTLHRAACGPTSCVNVLTGYGLDVNPTKDIVGINFSATIGGVKEFMKKYGVEGESYSGLSNADYTSKIEEAFSEGRPIITLMHASKTGDTFWTSGGHFVAMVGQDTNGNIITLDSGSSNPARHTYTGGVEGLMTTLDGVWIANEAPDGIKKGERYVGYLGNEAVVSPVTGVLLEYGTYTDEDIDSVSGEKYRTNIDLKYPPNVLSIGENNQEANTQGESQTDSQPEEIVADKVGYAKILVLDTENYKKLENQMSSYPGCRWGGSSFLNKNETYKDLDNLTEAQIKDKENGWSDIDKTLYGYKEFAERYEEAGISGYVVYIDGFKCELPDENFNNENPGESKPYDGKDGEKIELENYEETTLHNIFDSSGKIKKQAEEELLLDSLYIKDEDYELASKRATEKLKAENLLKEDAVSSIYLPDEDLIFIKEGTILGRTLTDRELIEDYRHQKYEDYRKTNKSTKKDDSGEEKGDNEDKLVGNYLRIIMRDLDKTVVENVEDYMKLDNGEEDDGGDQEYKFEEGDLELLADAIHHEGCGSYDDPRGSKEDQLYLATSLGFTIINKLNSDSQYHHVAGWDWAPDKSKLYNLLCVVPCAAHGGKGWYAISDSGTMGGLKNRADAGEYEYCDMCMEAAEYIKEHDSKHLKNNGKYDSGYNVGDEMQHTCWEQGANFYGKRMWAHFREDYLFDPKE